MFVALKLAFGLVASLGWLVAGGQPAHLFAPSKTAADLPQYRVQAVVFQGDEVLARPDVTVTCAVSECHVAKDAPAGATVTLEMLAFPGLGGKLYVEFGVTVTREMLMVENNAPAAGKMFGESGVSVNRKFVATHSRSSSYATPGELTVATLDAQPGRPAIRIVFTASRSVAAKPVVAVR